MYLNYKRIIIFFLLFILIFIGIGYHKFFLRFIYPFFYKDLIFEEGRKNNLDPYLVAAIIYVESKFNSYVTSKKGARGLMQIMPRTGIWISENLGDDKFTIEDLYDPEINIKYGCWYLGWLKERFDGELSSILAAYNGGQGNVDKWIKNDEWDGKEENLDQIPLSETRGYVDKVIRIYHRYQHIYKD